MARTAVADVARWATVLVLLVLTGCPGPSAPAPAEVFFSGEELALLREHFPAALPPPPPDLTSRWADDPAAARLGRRLFFDARFSGPLLDGDNDGGPNALGTVGQIGRVSCAGCHLPQSAFADGRSANLQLSLGSGWTLRRTPSLLDVGHAGLLMWDGSKDALYNQVFGPLEAPEEMNGSRLYMAQELYRRYRPEYEALFGPMPELLGPRFPQLSPERQGCRRPSLRDPLECHGMPGDGAEYDGLSFEDQRAVTRVVANAGHALGAYQRLLSCGESKLDRYFRGEKDPGVTAEELRGARLFVGRGKCAGCHAGPLLSDQKFHVVGMKPETVSAAFRRETDRGAMDGLARALVDPLNTRSGYSAADPGRLPASVGEELLGAFRTPTLRCVSLRPSFMHTGQMRTLELVVQFVNRGGQRAGYLGTKELEPLGLTEAEELELVAFLRALDGPGPPAELRAP